MIDAPSDLPTNDRNRELLAEFLSMNDAPCAICGYNLRSLPGNVCPECGHRFGLRIGAPDVRFGPLLACLAPLLMMAGILLFFLAVLIVHDATGPGSGFWLFLGLGGVDAVVAVRLFRHRLTFLKLPPCDQRRYAALSIVLNLLAAIAAIAFV